MNEEDKQAWMRAQAKRKEATDRERASADPKKLAKALRLVADTLEREGVKYVSGGIIIDSHRNFGSVDGNPLIKGRTIVIMGNISYSDVSEDDE